MLFAFGRRILFLFTVSRCFIESFSISHAELLLCFGQQIIPTDPFKSYFDSINLLLKFWPDLTLMLLAVPTMVRNSSVTLICHISFMMTTGQRVWVNPRSLTALVRQANTVDMTRRSPSYEIRLAKYAERGFEVYVPSLDRKKIDPLVFEILQTH